MTRSDRSKNLVPFVQQEPLKLDKSNNKRIIRFHAPYFDKHVPPHGFLHKTEQACHALFHYYLTARNNLEREQETIVLEGEDEPQFNYRELFKSIALIHAVTPEKMAKWWKNVDMECKMKQLPLMPDEERYRFNRRIEVTQ